MKILNYEGNKIRLKKGLTLAVVNHYYGGKWAKTRKELCIIRKHYFANGKEKRCDFDIVESIAVLEKGYQPINSRESVNFTEIETA